MLALQQVTGNVAVFIQLLNGHNTLVRRNLEHGVGRGINNQIPALYVLIPEHFNDFCAGIGLIGQHTAACCLAEGFQHFLGEALGIGGQRIGRNDARNFPVADGGILTHGYFRQLAVSTLGCVGLAQKFQTVNIAQTVGKHIGDI